MENQKVEIKFVDEKGNEQAATVENGVLKFEHIGVALSIAELKGLCAYDFESMGKSLNRLVYSNAELVANSVDNGINISGMTPDTIDYTHAQILSESLPKLEVK